MRYSFANCVLNTDSYTFTRDGKSVPVEPQVFDLLQLLAQNPGRLIPKDELIEVVWDGRIVSEATISARINAARKAVGDSGKDQAIIRTVPRRGLEFLASVTTEAHSAAGPNQAGPAARQTIRYATSADGTQIAYAVSGEGPPILRASHHMTHLEREWNSALYRPLFDRLGAQNRLIRYDIRGAGLSDSSEGMEGEDSLDQHVDDLVSVADAAQLDRVPLCAQLNSAAVAIQFAARYPDRVSHLVIQEGYARGRAKRGVPEDDPFVGLMAQSWGNSESGFTRAWVAMAIPSLSYEEASEQISIFAASGTRDQALANRRVIDNYDVQDALAQVTCPTLVIHARTDALHPMKEGRLIAAGIEGAEFLVVQSANAVCISPDPTWTEQIDAMLEFIARV